jgi:molecular chaperone HtpG
MISEEKFYEKGEKFALIKNTEGKYFTFDEYRKFIEPAQKDKDGKLIYLYASSLEDQHSFIATARDKGYDVIVMDGILDNHFINTLEHKFDQSMFRRVDSDTIDKLILKEENNLSKLDETEKEKLKSLIEKNIEKEKFSVVFENLSESDSPFFITQPEFMRRMKDMSMIGGNQMGMGMPEFYNLVVNVNHPLMKTILDEASPEKQDELISQVYDLALISQNLLKGEKLTSFVRRSISLLK